MKITKIKDSTIASIAAKLGKLATANQIKNAVKLVESGKVEWYDANTIKVASQSDPEKCYYIERGERYCDCIWYGNHPELLCTHRIAALIWNAFVEAPATAPVLTYEQKEAHVELAAQYERYCAEMQDGMDYEAWVDVYTGWQALQEKYNSDKANWTDDDETEARMYEAQLGL